MPGPPSLSYFRVGAPRALGKNPLAADFGANPLRSVFHDLLMGLEFHVRAGSAWLYRMLRIILRCNPGAPHDRMKKNPNP